jgi:hypothetical protein
MADENTVFDAAFEFNMNGMSPEAAAEAGAHSDSQDAEIKRLRAVLSELSELARDRRLPLMQAVLVRYNETLKETS